MGETKPKTPSSLRSPKPKKTLGLSVPTALRLPHDDLIKPEETHLTPVTRVTPPSPRPSTPTRHPGSPDVAPKRDFQKVANSITREAIPSGMFNGKAKQLYDCLYSLTRGAIMPSMTVRISRAELMKKSGIGAKVTLEQNLKRLALSGLVTIRTIGGVQGGNEYTVRLPEETLPSTPPSTGTSPSSPPSGGEKVGVLAPLESSPPSHGLTPTYQITSEEPKTSFKTKEEKIDDDAVLAALREAERKLTGKESNLSAWTPLFELLSTELRIAAARTTVSNVPAFLTEHLRRRLWKVDKARATELAADAPEQESTAPAYTAEERQKCPDCAGVGFWYPEGPEKGVARCSHLKLQSIPEG